MGRGWSKGKKRPDISKMMKGFGGKIMSGVNFLQVVEYIDEKLATVIGDEYVYVLVGRSSGKLLGLMVTKGGVKGENTRHIYFHDIDNMKRIVEMMEGKDGL